MCGIAGWIDADGGVDPSVLFAIRETLEHRGPDGAGLSCSQDRRVGLAHRRLSIIDLSESAAQPMIAGDDETTIAFNGEIYNHRALRTELEAEGVRFRTDHSDTEVLLEGYLHWGLEKLLRKLVGMFAFAIHDPREGRVVLVRDRIGIKPLYVVRRPRGLVFASEAKALFAHPAIDPELDLESFYHYLSFRAVPAPRSLFRGIEKLGAGEMMIVDVASGEARRRIWWDPLEEAAAAPSSYAGAVDRLDELMGSALQLRMEADVPVGVFLSGGVDSGLLLQLASQQRQDLNTFTVHYPGHDGYNEHDAAAQLARACGANHHEIPIHGGEYAAAMASVAYHQDEPIAAPVCTPVYMLSQAARAAGVPVVLAGEGSDEIFIGYDNWIRFRRLMQLDRLLPDLPGRLLRKAGHAALAASLSPLATHPEVLRRSKSGQPLFWSGAMDFGEDAKRRLLGPAVPTQGLDTYDAVIAPVWERYRDRRGGDDLVGWMTYVDLQFRLPELMLPRLDKMGMAHSIEGRVPILDHRIVEFQMGLPQAWRGGRGSETKPMFKEVAARYLPKEFVYAKKRGFQAPVKEWRDSSFQDQLVPALRAFAERTGLLNVSALDNLLAAKSDRLFFSLTNLMLWHQVYLEPVVADLLPEVEHQPWRSRRVLSGAAS